MDIVREGNNGRMSDVVVYNGLAFLSGAVGRTGTTVTEQMADALAEVDRVLALVGSDKSRILSATVWLADITDFDAMNAVWDNWVDKANAPARATGQVPLAREKYRVEVTVIAAAGR